MNLPNLFKSTPKVFDTSSVKYRKPIDEQLVNKLIDYLQSAHKHLSKLGLQRIMAGLDGETGSLAAALLLKQAIKEDVVAIILDLGTADTNNLIAFCNSLALNTYLLKRGEAFQAEISAYNLHKPFDIRNFSKRFINYHISIQADHMKAAVLDTIDKSDRLLGSRPVGFYGHFMPFYSLYKSELFDLASYLKVPVENGQDYQELPYPDDLVLTYDKVDPVLYLLTEKQLTPEQISQEFNIDLHWLKRLKSHIDKQPLKTTVSQLLI